MSCRVLGIDPGTATTGYGVIDIFGVEGFSYITSGIISTHKSLKMAERLRTIRADMLELLTSYTPDLVVVESIFFFRNATTLVPVAQARGVIIEAAAHAGVEIVEYTPMQVKLNVAGYGRADKKEMQFSVAKVLQQERIIKPDDASDALALAICHARAQSALNAVQPVS